MITITSTDLRNAADIAATTLPCTGSLRKNVQGGNTAYCIMGCIVKAIARRTKKSFDATKEALKTNAGYGLSNDLANLLKLDFDPIVNNDTHHVEGAYKAKYEDDLTESDFVDEIERLRNWQTTTLYDMAAKMDKLHNGSVKI